MESIIVNIVNVHIIANHFVANQMNLAALNATHAEVLC